MAALVVVLGDIGRSPRMMNHACMLLAHTSYDVHILAYRDSPMYTELEANPRVHMHSICAVSLCRGCFLLYALIRLLCQTLQILWILLQVRGTRVAFVQNPPAIPALALVLLVSFVKNFPVYLDWHNYSFSLLSIAGRSRKVVSLARLYEQKVGRLADRHFCVSQAMQSDLATHFHVQ